MNASSVQKAKIQKGGCLKRKPHLGGNAAIVGILTQDDEKKRRNIIGLTKGVTASMIDRRLTPVLSVVSEQEGRGDKRETRTRGLEGEMTIGRGKKG